MQSIKVVERNAGRRDLSIRAQGSGPRLEELGYSRKAGERSDMLPILLLS